MDCRLRVLHSIIHFSKAMTVWRVRARPNPNGVMVLVGDLGLCNAAGVWTKLAAICFGGIEDALPQAIRI